MNVRPESGGSPPPSNDPTAPARNHPLTAFFFGPNGLRVGWRLAIAILLWFVFSGILSWLVMWIPGVHAILRGRRAIVLTPTTVLVTEGILAAAAVLSGLVMSRIERRSFADYGLPGTAAFGKRFSGCNLRIRDDQPFDGLDRGPSRLFGKRDPSPWFGGGPFRFPLFPWLHRRSDIRRILLSRLFAIDPATGCRILACRSHPRRCIWGASPRKPRRGRIRSGHGRLLRAAGRIHAAAHGNHLVRHRRACAMGLGRDLLLFRPR